MSSPAVVLMLPEAMIPSDVHLETIEVLLSHLLKLMNSGISLLKPAAVMPNQPLPHANLTQSSLTSTHASDFHTTTPSNWLQIPSSMDGYLMISLPRTPYSEDVKSNQMDSASLLQSTLLLSLSLSLTLTEYLYIQVFNISSRL